MSLPPLLIRFRLHRLHATIQQLTWPSKVAVGGGYRIPIVELGAEIIGSSPTETGDGWHMSLIRGQSFGVPFSMRVACVTPM